MTAPRSFLDGTPIKHGQSRFLEPLKQWPRQYSTSGRIDKWPNLHLNTSWSRCMFITPNVLLNSSQLVPFRYILTKKAPTTNCFSRLDGEVSIPVRLAHWARLKIFGWLDSLSLEIDDDPEFLSILNTFISKTPRWTSVLLLLYPSYLSCALPPTSHSRTTFFKPRQCLETMVRMHFAHLRFGNKTKRKQSDLTALLVATPSQEFQKELSPTILPR